MANENFDKVYDHIRENHIWDDIYMDITEDQDDNTYIIVDSHSDIDKLHAVVKEVLDIQEDKFYVDEVLEVEIVFSDEYTTCSDCHKIIRTSPNSYHWQPDFYMGDGFIVCNKCFNEQEDYQEAYIEDKINDPKTAINGLVSEEQLEQLGFERINEEYESGWYHKEDNPEEIYDKLSDKYEEIVFFINNVEQFRINFVTFVRGEI
jgi:hypothetical protein